MIPEFLTEAAFWTGLTAAAVRFAAPILFAALGETIVERSGVLNIGIEGMMLIGAWAAFLAAHGSGSNLVGVLGGIAVGAVSGLILAYLCVTRQAHQIVVGITINLFALGLTSFVFRALFTRELPTIDSIKGLDIPYLSSLPIVGPVLFSHTWLVYLAFALVPVTAFLLNRTHFGLAVSAAGEMPAAVDGAGIDVARIRYSATLLAGGFAGLAGASLSLGQLSQFTDNMTAGRGFFALAVVLVGRWRPLYVMWGTFLFAISEALALRLQFETAIPHQFLRMLPFLVAILLMAGVFGRPVAPSQLAVPYRRESTG